MRTYLALVLYRMAERLGRSLEEELDTAWDTPVTEVDRVRWDQR